MRTSYGYVVKVARPEYRPDRDDPAGLAEQQRLRHLRAGLRCAQPGVWLADPAGTVRRGSLAGPVLLIPGRLSHGSWT